MKLFLGRVILSVMLALTATLVLRAYVEGIKLAAAGHQQ
jgi:hypothetical protein